MKVRGWEVVRMCRINWDFSRGKEEEEEEEEAVSFVRDGLEEL